MKNFESYVVLIAAILYAVVGISYFIKGNLPWGIIWFSYSVANFGLSWAATIK